ncbi:hypothetical protein D5S18_13755 [Nocardia panacis]|uniref:GyrI-like small molecule binding domain-containing protein n=1 Tax=Nocardia panacis TaxID=2340916 RepID=A0A3A4KI14_9NOCA|nr:GyrI-like domain-containing protein [Nocardia panacis]RJO75836.1 hypothetical protein D5S18_13755 [Nocardia panacis]
MKIDLLKADRDYYDAPTEPTLRTFGPYPYATVVGVGEPEGERYVEAVGELYRAVYGAKKQAKAQGRDFTVAKLEGLWWVEGDREPLKVPRAEWHWKMMIRVPEFVAAQQLQGVAHEWVEEGECVQVMHIGPYATEPETLARLEAFIAESGLTYRDRHHEIYLSDPRRTAPERMKTILRQPVQRISRPR